jgi:hypothetical protein
MMPAHMIWLVAFVAWPEPAGPKCSMVLPMAPSTGFAAAKASGVPPHMMARVAFCAPSTPPLTGASTNKAPRAARKLSAQRAVSALTVEQSMTSVPLVIPGAMPSMTERTSASADTQMTMAESGRANSGSDVGAVTPSSAASACALSALRFHTECSSAARCRFLAMGRPMAPNPNKPTRVIGAELSGAGATNENAVPGTAFVELREGVQPCGPQMASTALRASTRVCASSASERYSRWPPSFSR